MSIENKQKEENKINNLESLRSFVSENNNINDNNFSLKGGFFSENFQSEKLEELLFLDNLQCSAMLNLMRFLFHLIAFSVFLYEENLKEKSKLL